MWPVRSLVFQTDLFLVGLAGRITFRDRYVVVSTPSNPDFWWGNFLLYRDAPTAEDATSGLWLEDFARELPHASATLLAWDRPDGAQGALEEFLPLGFTIDDGVVLTATAESLVRPAKADPDIVVRALASEDDWLAAVLAQTNAFAPRRSGSLADLRTFVVRQYASFRAMQESGVGTWYGAFLGDELAGSLGLVRVNGGALGRFQLVGVDPRFGRRGVCAAMVHDVARHALTREGFGTLVMAADATYHAAKIYESCGFRQAEHIVAIVKKPPKS